MTLLRNTLLAFATLLPLAHAEVNLDALQGTNQGLSPLPQGWTAGGIIYSGSSPYQAQSSSQVAIPGAIYIGKDWLYLGDRVQGTLYKNEYFNLYGVGRFRTGNLAPSDQESQAGLNARKWGLDAGIGAHIFTPVGLITARISSDITGRSKGQDGILWFDVPLIKERWAIMPGVGLTWRSRNMANYYYGGVSDSEAAPGRPAYDVGSSLSYSASLIATYRINQHWLAGLVLSAERYPDNIRSSPLIQKNGEYDFLAGLGYTW